MILRRRGLSQGMILVVAYDRLPGTIAFLTFRVEVELASFKLRCPNGFTQGRRNKGGRSIRLWDQRCRPPSP